METQIKEIKEYFDMMALDKSPHTIKSYERSTKRFLSFLCIHTFGDIENISASDCRNFQAKLSAIEIAPGKLMSKASVNTNVRPVKAMFNWFVEQEYLENSPFDRVKALKQTRKVPVYLTREETISMIRGSENLLDKFLVCLFVTTGLRRQEMANLKLTDINDCHILVKGKGSKERVLRLQDDICVLMKEYLVVRNKRPRYRDSEYLFVSRRGTKFAGSGLLFKIKQIAINSGIPEDRAKKITVHSLRHTFTANMVESGADIRLIQGALGHSSINTTERYAHIRSSALDKAMQNQGSVFGDINE